MFSHLFISIKITFVNTSCIIVFREYYRYGFNHNFLRKVSRNPKQISTKQNKHIKLLIITFSK